MEHIVVSQMMRHANSHDILYDKQHGFREKRSCETQLICFVDDILRNMADNRQTDIIVMDFAKAFNRVEHNSLCHKLARYGIDGQTNT